MSDPRTITIRRSEFGGFTVSIDPQPAIPVEEASFSDHLAAYSHASGLRLVHGGKVVDLAGERP